ncbi:MAG TPA: carbohydrate ABC transporter permease [Candidatus Binatia bacterium]|nr:carbohydrate ABC transporter permease [Candidatus Binatia bacterium]
MRRSLVFGAVVAVALVDLVPLALVLKQAFTPEGESVAWPPTWVPHTLTLENFRAVAAAVDLWPALARSGIVAVLTVALTLALVVPAGLVARRLARTDRALDAVLVLTRVMPSIALAVPLAALFVRAGLYNQPAGFGLVLAHTLTALPLGYLVARGGLRAVPPDVEEAALLDGATPARVALHVTLPIARPALGAAAMLVFLLSWDEFAYALLLQVTNRSLPPLLYYFAAFGHPGLASAVAAIMLGPALAIVLVLEPTLRGGVVAGSGR